MGLNKYNPAVERLRDFLFEVKKTAYVLIGHPNSLGWCIHEPRGVKPVLLVDHPSDGDFETGKPGLRVDRSPEQPWLVYTRTKGSETCAVSRSFQRWGF